MTKHELLNELIGVPDDMEIQMPNGLPVCSVQVVTLQGGREVLVLSDEDPDPNAALARLQATLCDYWDTVDKLRALPEESQEYGGLVDQLNSLELRLRLLAEDGGM